jgi:hypothetical protein
MDYGRQASLPPTGDEGVKAYGNRVAKAEATEDLHNWLLARMTGGRKVTNPRR